MTSVPSAAELIHLGMDTSVNEIVVAVLRPGEEVPVVDRIPGDEESVRRLIGRFPDRRLLSACYEAGPGGYELHCDTRSHVVSERVEEVWLMPGT